MKDLRFICEEWRDIPNFEGYQVSSFGKIRGVDRLRKSRHGLRLIKGQELKQVLNKKGYPEVRLRKQGSHTRLVHKLVCSAFITKPTTCTQINHVNGIKTDNRVENLEWVTQSENIIHSKINNTKLI
jgi:predicted RNA binding protein YcfA (HicA-like mRNA interferase family)